MSKYIKTVHYASIPVYSKGNTTMHQEYLRQKAVRIIVEFVLPRHNKVRINEEFRCVFLTEVGLVSDCLESLKECVEEIVEIVQSKSYLELGI